MKNKMTLVIMAIVAVLLFACKSQEKKWLDAIETSEIDSCQKGVSDQINYFIGDTIVRRSANMTYVIVRDTIIQINFTETEIKELNEMLNVNWPFKPETPGETALRRIKKMVQAPMDSCIKNLNLNMDSYSYYFKSIKLEVDLKHHIPFEQKAELLIFAYDTDGVLLSDLCGCLSQDQKVEIWQKTLEHNLWEATKKKEMIRKNEDVWVSTRNQ